MIWWLIAAAVASFVKGLCGFANTLVFDTIMGFAQDSMQIITPVELVINMPSNAIMVWRERKHIVWRICLPAAALIIVGTIPGMLLLKNVDAQWLKLAFGIIVMLLGAEMLLRELQHKKVQPNPIVTAAIGIISGVMCGAFGVGALMAAYMSRVSDDTASFRANISVAFLANALFRCVAYACTGIITADTLKISLLLMPVMVIGTVLGIRCAHILPEQRVKRCVTVALILSGLALVINNLP
jgi:uncharacterized protein